MELAQNVKFMIAIALRININIKILYLNGQQINPKK